MRRQSFPAWHQKVPVPESASHYFGAIWGIWDAFVSGGRMQMGGTFPGGTFPPEVILKPRLPAATPFLLEVVASCINSPQGVDGELLVHELPVTAHARNRFLVGRTIIVV